MAASPLHSRGPKLREPKSELAASTMPSGGPKSGRKCYVTPAFSGVPNKGEHYQNWLPQPCLLGGRKVGGSAASPLNSRGSPSKENFFELAASTTPSRGPKRGRKCYVTAAFWGVPNKGEQIQNWLPQPCLLGAQKWAEVLLHPCILGGPQQRGTKSELAASTMPPRGPKSGWKCYVTFAFSGVPNKGNQNQNWLPQPCLLGGPKVGGSATSPLHSRGSPTKGNKIRIGYLNHAFSRAQKRAEVLRHRCILGGPKQRGKYSQLAALAMPSQGPKSGRKCYFTPAFSGVPNKGEPNQNWLPHPCRLGGPKVGMGPFLVPCAMPCAMACGGGEVGP